MTPEQQLILQLLESELGRNPVDYQCQAVQGGDTHSGMALFSTTTQHADYFVKLNSLEKAAVLKSEFVSLQTLATLFPQPYPQPILFEVLEDHAFLFMPFLKLQHLDDVSGALAGQQLALQHQVTNKQFGWPQDNYIGSSPQLNHWQQQWPEFYRDNRLMPLLDVARRKNLDAKEVSAIETICLNIERWFADYQPRPSLLHGDLWSGNIAWNTEKKRPAFYDPAPYFGDHEADIAMTELFGRLPTSFYEQYHQTWQLDAGYTDRKPLYNLYHALNHFVLFGHGYQAMVQAHTLELRRFLNN